MIPGEKLGDFRVSIIIPVRQAGTIFNQCMLGVAALNPQPHEVIVVFDGSPLEDQPEVPAGMRTTLTGTVSGPAVARNTGARIAAGNLLFFLDSDVVVHTNAIEKINQIFERHTDTMAAIGSYDDSPGASNFLSQFRNLFHHYTHQISSEEASTFWGACGVVDREVFLDLGGFDPIYTRPSIEDIELGYRIKKNGHQIYLCKDLFVKHLKRWTLFSMVKTDIFQRAIPWSDLIFQEAGLLDDLNLQVTNRISVVLIYLAVTAGFLAIFWPISGLIALGSLLVLIVLNWDVYRFYRQKKGGLFMLRSVPFHWGYYLYSGMAFAFSAAKFFFRRLGFAGQDDLAGKI